MKTQLLVRLVRPGFPYYLLGFWADGGLKLPGVAFSLACVFAKDLLIKFIIY